MSVYTLVLTDKDERLISDAAPGQIGSSIGPARGKRLPIIPVIAALMSFISGAGWTCFTDPKLVSFRVR